MIITWTCVSADCNFRDQQQEPHDLSFIACTEIARQERLEVQMIAQILIIL